MTTRLVTLTGGGPWGLVLTGGKEFGSPLQISKVTAGGKAARGGVKEGDYVIAINREPAEEMLHFEAQQVIKAAGSSLQLKLSTTAPKSPSIPHKQPHDTTDSAVTRPHPPPPPPGNTAKPSPVTYTSTTHTTAAAQPRTVSPPPQQQSSQIVPDAGLSTGSTSLQQSPAFKRIRVNKNPTPSILSPGSRPPPPPTERMQRVTIDEPNVKKTSYKPPPPHVASSVKKSGITINKPSPPPTIVKPPPPPTATSPGASPPRPAGSQEKFVERQGVCASCHEPIRGAYASAVGLTWHPEHFNCSACQRQLQNTMFVFEEDKIFCEDCYQTVYAKKCHSCHRAIVGPSVSAQGLCWHQEHFRCSRCNCDLTQGEGFNMEANQLFCGDCYGAAYGATCFGCGQKIGGEELWVEAMDHQWHSQCFKCESCKRPLEGGSFFAKLGRPYCRECA